MYYMKIPNLGRVRAFSRKWGPLLSLSFSFITFIHSNIGAIQAVELWLVTHRTIVLSSFFTLQRLVSQLALLVVILLIASYYLQRWFAPAAWLWERMGTRGTQITPAHSYALITAISIIGVVVSSITYSIPVPGCFRTGDLLVASDRTVSNTDWYDPVNAYPGDVIEFNMWVESACPNAVARNVIVLSILPTNTMNPLIAYAYIFSDNAGAIHDTAVVDIVGTPQAFEYIPGSVWVVSPACPSGCTGSDSVNSNGVNIGDLQFGEHAEVRWLAYVTNYVASTR
jgi:hypothetical protein